MKTLAERLQYAMDHHPAGKMKAATLARDSNVTRATISLILNGDTSEPKSSNLIAMARALDVRFEWLRTGEEPMREIPRMALSVREETALYADGGRLYQDVLDAQHRHERQDVLVVAQLNVSGSMGDGAHIQQHVESVTGIEISISNLRRQATFTSPANLRFITGYGDSMEPTFRDGDILLIDEGVNTVEIDGIYVFTLGNHGDDRLFIKTLQRRLDGSLLMVSHNRTAYEPQLIGADTQITIHGRVCLAWNARRL